MQSYFLLVLCFTSIQSVKMLFLRGHQKIRVIVIGYDEAGAKIKVHKKDLMVCLRTNRKFSCFFDFVSSSITVFSELGGGGGGNSLNGSSVIIQKVTHPMNNKSFPLRSEIAVGGGVIRGAKYFCSYSSAMHTATLKGGSIPQGSSSALDT